MERLVAMVNVTDELGVRVRRDIVENLVIEALDENVVPRMRALDESSTEEEVSELRRIVDLAARLNFSPRRFDAILRPHEEALGTEPAESEEGPADA
jgi:hypothetical protein